MTDQQAIMVEALQPMPWSLQATLLAAAFHWAAGKHSGGSSGLDFTKILAQGLTNPCSSGRDALQSMPNFWDRGSEFKIIMVDPFLELFFSGSRPVSGVVAPWELCVCCHSPSPSCTVSAGLIPKG